MSLDAEPRGWACPHHDLGCGDVEWWGVNDRCHVCGRQGVPIEEAKR